MSFHSNFQCVIKKYYFDRARFKTINKYDTFNYPKVRILNSDECKKLI